MILLFSSRNWPSSIYKHFMHSRCEYWKVHFVSVSTNKNDGEIKLVPDLWKTTFDCFYSRCQHLYNEGLRHLRSCNWKALNSKLSFTMKFTNLRWNTSASICPSLKQDQKLCLVGAFPNLKFFWWSSWIWEQLFLLSFWRWTWTKRRRMWLAQRFRARRPGGRKGVAFNIFHPKFGKHLSNKEWKIANTCSGSSNNGLKYAIFLLIMFLFRSMIWQGFDVRNTCFFKFCFLERILFLSRLLVMSKKTLLKGFLSSGWPFSKMLNWFVPWFKLVFFLIDYFSTSKASFQSVKPFVSGIWRANPSKTERC